jgi:hypothetical protein
MLWNALPPRFDGAVSVIAGQNNSSAKNRGSE